MKSAAELNALYAKIKPLQIEEADNCIGYISADKVFPPELVSSSGGGLFRIPVKLSADKPIHKYNAGLIGRLYDEHDAILEQVELKLKADAEEYDEVYGWLDNVSGEALAKVHRLEIAKRRR